MTYLLDANVFIQAKNFHYDFDVCPRSGTGWIRRTQLEMFSASAKSMMRYATAAMN